MKKAQIFVLAALTACTAMAEANPWWIGKLGSAAESEKSLREAWNRKYPSIKNISQLHKEDLGKCWIQETYTKTNPPKLSGKTVYVPYDKNMNIVSREGKDVRFIVRVTADGNGEILLPRKVGGQVVEFIQFARIQD